MSSTSNPQLDNELLSLLGYSSPSNTHTIIAIDPGLDGGIAIYNESAKTNKIKVAKMPILESGININKLNKTIYTLSQLNDTTIAFIEQQWLRPRSFQPGSLRNIMVQYGVLIGILSALDIKNYIVSPRAWKKTVLQQTSKNKKHAKQLAIKKAQELYPNISLTPGRTTTPQDGLADALCILTYGLLKLNIQQTSNKISSNKTS